MSPHDLTRVLRLILVTDDRLIGDRDLVEVCQAAVGGGVTAIQLRLKDASPRDLVSVFERLRTRVGVPILINDRADVALACGADGVHVGPEDVPVPLVRGLAPAGFLIGASVGSVGEVDGGRGADYWGVGPFRTTSTKRDAGPALDVDEFRAIVRMGEGRPCVAIGGVRPEDVAVLSEAGAVGVAVASGILAESDTGAAAIRYASRL
jgi:thiamine-phosphate pyrophosphorylase